ncbi:MAG TPA: OB-fold nucleic acid binding domain-containing protein, partial [Candidatus Saccharimonadales bacterium]
VYQEQVMQISKEVCGFSGGDADTLRKAIGKKNAALMAKMKDKMIAGGQEYSGIDRALMEKFWKQLEDFAAYCFNKSHAACYGLIAYQTAYLKAHYPAAFMAALMTSDFDDTDRLAIEITECKHMGITVLPPDVNESFQEFAVVPGKKEIRFGMTAIKNVGAGAVEEILRARDEAQFTSLEDFLTRVNSRIVNRKAMESLIKAGAFDRYGDRSLLLHNLDLLQAFASRLQKQASSGQTDIFGSLSEEVIERPSLELQPAATTFDTREQLVWERELLGLYLSQHPLELFETILAEQTVPLNTLTADHDGKSVSVGGAVTDVREITTKNGQKMAFIKLEDQFGEVEVILFPSSYQRTVGLWERDRVVLIRGKVNTKDRDGNRGSDVKIMVDDAREITSQQAAAYQATGRTVKTPKTKPGVRVIKSVGARAAEPEKTLNPRVYIRLQNTSDEETLINLKQTIDSHSGETEVVLVLGDSASKQAIKLPGGIDQTSDGLTQLKELVGTENLVIR